MTKRNFLVYIMLLSATVLLADDVMLVRTKDGRAFAKKTADIDSVYFASSADVPDGLFSWTDTIKTVTRFYVNHDSKSVNSIDQWHYSIENPLVADYMNTVDYTGYADDYQYSAVQPYIDEKTDYVKYRPAGVRISWDNAGTQQYVQLSYLKDFSVLEENILVADGDTEFTVVNMYPDKKYYYRVLVEGNVVKEGHFFTVGQVRMINLRSMFNLRDLGGWQTVDGHRIKYGKIYRGSEMNRSSTVTPENGHVINVADSAYMHDTMKIRLDIDLRDKRDLYLGDDDPTNDIDHTVLGDDVDYYNEAVNHNHQYFIQHSYYTDMRWGRVIKKIIAALSNDKNVYIHCTWGADRTGTLVMLLQGLLGVSESDISKEYELTSFCYGKLRSNEYWGPNLEYIKTLYGNTLQEQITTYCMGAGVSSSEIETFRTLMLE